MRDWHVKKANKGGRGTISRIFPSFLPFPSTATIQPRDIVKREKFTDYKMPDFYPPLLLLFSLRYTVALKKDREEGIGEEEGGGGGKELLGRRSGKSGSSGQKIRREREEKKGLSTHGEGGKEEGDFDCLFPPSLPAQCFSPVRAWQLPRPRNKTERERNILFPFFLLLWHAAGQKRIFFSSPSLDWQAFSVRPSAGPNRNAMCVCVS